MLIIHQVEGADSIKMFFINTDNVSSQTTHKLPIPTSPHLANALPPVAPQPKSDLRVVINSL